MLPRGNQLWLRRVLRSRCLKLLVAVFCLFSILDAFRISRNIAVADSIQPTSSPFSFSSSPLLSSSSSLSNIQKRQLPPPRPRVYITGMHFNDEVVLRDSWINAVLHLTEALGPDNIFVSVSESGSWDGTKQVLQWLDGELEARGVPHLVKISDKTHKDEIRSTGYKGEGWINTPSGERLPRRIPFLSRLRNQALQPLLDLHDKGISFDRVLFLNDVVFTAQDVLTLLDTNGGDYAAACSLDFAAPPQYYDTFALRDSDGKPHAIQTWPYFASSESRAAMMEHSDAVPVQSCWNGIVAMPVEPFVSSTRLRFRGVPDSLAEHHLEGSECCLIHADNPLSKTQGVFINPRVRVGYSLAAYEGTHPGNGSSWVSPWQVLSGLWQNRIWRWLDLSTLESLRVKSRLKRWEDKGSGRREPGGICIVDEMHVLITRGWAHV